MDAKCYYNNNTDEDIYTQNCLKPYLALTATATKSLRVQIGHIYVYYMYTICILYVYYMYTICILHVYYMYTICILYVYYMYTTCILYVYYMYTIYILYVYYMYTICIHNSL